MAYESEKDKVLKKWQCEETGLVVAICQYGESEPKLQIGPRVYKRKDGEESQRKAGRLSIEDLLWFYDNIDEIKEEFTDLAGPA
ncbi:MAG: hypothetical protein Q8P24_21695 [Desulfobacterales bacterium]|nr:hypothetical protein [Desulfobacterales bacterium]